jgi:cytochrome c peroxidase
MEMILPTTEEKLILVQFLLPDDNLLLIHTLSNKPSLMKLMKSPTVSASLIGACFLIITFPFVFLACAPEEPQLTDDLVLPDVPYFYNNADNFMATLGRVLFYDKNLSANNSVSCSSCHKQSRAFADDRQFSLGFANGQTRRNSMPIQDLNPSDSSTLFWDGREKNLKIMVLKPIVDHVEMGMTDLDALSQKLSVINNYKILFKDAYGTEEVNETRIGAALAAFVGAIESRFIDTTFSNLTGEAKDGAALFVTKYQCNNCHQIQSPHGYVQGGTFANIGLDEDYSDDGFGEVSRWAGDNGKFKIPSLRNVALTAPYMHDGRFATLEEAIDHYSTGIKAHPNLDVRLKNPDGSPKVFAISPDEKKALVAFLNSLSNDEVVTDIRFSDPFRH